MFESFVKTAWRNVITNKGFSTLNILGLAAGMAVALLIGLWMDNQYSYDRFLPGYEQVYQVQLNATNNGVISTFNTTSLALADGLRNEIPEMEDVAETDYMTGHGLMVGDKKLYLNGGQVAGSFLQLFGYPLLQGTAGQALSDPYSIVLTETTAKALFGEKEALGRLVRYDDEHDLKVTGVLKDIPANSTLRFNFLVPFSYYEQANAWVKAYRAAGWNPNAFQLFVRLKPHVTYAQVEPRIKNIIKLHEPSSNEDVIMQPIKDWHLYHDFKNGQPAGGLIEYVRMFALIGILVLLIACINFVNLATAQSRKRAREVGVRKAIGSGRMQLIGQFLVESLLVVSFSFLLALLLVWAALPAFNALTAEALQIPAESPVFWLLMLSCTLITALVAGSRPAFYLSSFRPVKVLKGQLIGGKSASLPRKILVVLQLSCSIALIISTITIGRQVTYAQERPVGFETNRLMITDLNSSLDVHVEPLRNDMLATGLVSAVALSSSPATDIFWHSSIPSWPGKQAGETVNNMGTIAVSENYFKTMGMDILSGRDFSGPEDSLGILLNEAAVKKLHILQPLDQVITWQDNRRYRIIGVVRDALMSSPFASPDPTMFMYNPGKANYILYRLSPAANTTVAIDRLTTLFNRSNPAYPYRYQFADAKYAGKFNFETLVGKLAALFAGLAIFISCLGLFGLAASMAESRTKEIGIRKVLGASVAGLWLLLSGEFIVLVAVSSAIASPVAFYFMNNWLLKYDYRISMGAGIFVAAALMALFITLCTVSFHAIKAARMSPVLSIRSE
jgi:putative ABC transport system permease protein